MKRLTQFGIWLSLLLLAIGFSLPAAAKGGERRQGKQANRNTAKPPNNSGNQTKPPVNDEKNKNPNSASGQRGNPNSGANPRGGIGANGGENPQGNGRAGLGLPPKFVENLREMTPEQQERFMRNNERFRNMPPERQAQIRKNLQNWNSLTPAQRSVMRTRETAFEQMNPQERQYVQQEMRPAWRDMVPGQRRFMLLHLHELYGMSEPEARAKLGDPAFMQGMTAEQQKMLPYLYRLRVGMVPEPAGPPES